MHKKFNLIKTIGYALEGLFVFVKKEHNVKLHILASIIAILVSLLLKISILEWALVIFCIAFVFAMEAMNTAIEYLSDFICKEKHPKIKRVKDISAGAVLISALCSIVIAIIIFIPKLIDLFIK